MADNDTYLQTQDIHTEYDEGIDTDVIMIQTKFEYCVCSGGDLNIRLIEIMIFAYKY